MKCQCCGQEIETKKRTPEQNRCFNGWLTFLARITGHDRDHLKATILLRAVVTALPPGGKPYRYSMVPGLAVNPISGKQEVVDMLSPISTSKATKGEMITACHAIEMWLADKQQQGFMTDVHLPINEEALI